MVVVQRWTGREARALRHGLRISVSGFAEHLGVAIRTVAKWEERGTTIAPSPEMQAALDTALHRAGDEVQSRFELLLQEQEQGGEDVANRRDATKLIGAAALGALAQPDTVEVLARSSAIRARGWVDDQLVAGHEEVSATLAGLYRSADPRAALPAAMSYADSTLELLDQPMSDRVRSRLFTIVVGVHAQVGLWACHSGRFAVARRYLSTACDVAAASDNAPLLARALGALSYLFSSAPRGGHGGNPSRALELLDEALELAVDADGFTRGWLATWRGDQHATLGNVAAAHADVCLAERGLGSANDSQVSGFFSRSTYGYGIGGHLVRLRTVTLALNGDNIDLDGAFADVLSATANVRHRVCALANLAVVSAAADEPEAACSALGQSVSLAEREDYVMGLQRAFGVRHGFSTKWSSLTCARDLDKQLRQHVA